MDSDKLYRVKKEDIPKLERLLTVCFAKDPLYCKLIPDEDTRNRLLPELFHCDLEEMFETCEIFADSPELNGILVVSDESEPYNFFRYYLTELRANLKTDEYLIKEDPSLRAFWNFVLGKDYLNEKWTDQLHQEERSHIIYLAVDPEKQHHHISSLLMDEAIAYADAHHLMMSLETHNEHNVAMYEHFGFKLYGVMEKHFDLKQYCLIREVQ